MAVRKKILVCPLDWGLGHATRLVPVIESLLERKAEVIIGADNRPYEFLANRFPDCDLIRFPGYSPRYPVRGSMALLMIKEYPRMKRSAQLARERLHKIVREKKIDVVISDNRYELYTEDTVNIFISHQLNMHTPGLTILFKPFLQRTINGYIRQFDELWIPDADGNPNLSGKLSRPKRYPLKSCFFIGPLTRFSKVTSKEIVAPFDLLVILSGPEPQRTILEEKLIKQIKETDLRTVVLQGKPELQEKNEEGNIRFLTHADDETMAGLYQAARYVISRPGYTTLMDLSVFGSKAMLIPTPGQTEQEYLAHKVEKEGLYYTAKQQHFQIEKALQLADNYKGLQWVDHNHTLEQRLNNLFS